MNSIGEIITVGLCPSWDMVCEFKSIDWGQHKVVDSSTNKPAGKALNISKALAFTGQKSTAAGLWGAEDFNRMQKMINSFTSAIKLRMTKAAGDTRQNISIVDLAGKREMHLRNESKLATKTALGKLKGDLAKLAGKNSVCVFAGAMPPQKLLGDVIAIMNNCRKKGAKIALDTSGQPLKKIVGAGGLWLIKPNVEEFCFLLGKNVKDAPADLARAAKKLLTKVEMILISRGKKGAMIVTRDGSYNCSVVGEQKVLCTVGCGDSLLAGFLGGFKQKANIKFALETAVKVGTAKAWGLTKGRWQQTARTIKVKIEEI